MTSKSTTDIFIYGKKGSGKTATAVYLAYTLNKKKNYKNIFSNFEIKMDNWKPLYIHNINIWNIEKYRDSLMIIDEGMTLIDSRRAMNKANKDITEMFFQLRKVNCDTIFITQRFFDVDTRIRSQIKYEVRIKKFITPQKTIFKARVFDTDKGRFIQPIVFNGAKVFNMYDTSSIVSNTKSILEWTKTSELYKEMYPEKLDSDNND